MIESASFPTTENYESCKEIGKYDPCAAENNQAPENCLSEMPEV